MVTRADVNDVEQRERELMIYVWTFLLAPVVLWIAYNFVVGFVQGFKQGWQRPRWRGLKFAWRLCQMANPDHDQHP